MALTADELRITLLARMEFGPAARRPLDERLAERLTALTQSQRAAARSAAEDVVGAATRLVREFRAGKLPEDRIEPALLELFPWLSAGATPHALPSKGLTAQVRSFAYYLVMK